ncbi:MAG TPA: alpha/beta fold hydrolase [Candidatus Limnocylindrales bacterium]|nr:alpha/beta fold hydrolase [Candidatus Limnocylindrales bacterium]
MTDRSGSRPDDRRDDATHARHEADHPEWARFRRPDPEPEPQLVEPEPTEPEPIEGTANAVVAPPSSAAPAAPEPEPAGAAAGEIAPVADPAPHPGMGTWRAPVKVEPGLEARIRRDLGRGRTVVRLTWVAALASLVLGLVAVRQAALLVAIDPKLVTTEEVQAAGASFDAARTVLMIAVVVGIVLAIRWLRSALPTYARLRELGVIDGPPPGSGLRRFGLLWRPSGVPAEHAGWSDVRVGPGRRLAALAVATVVLATVVGLAAALLLGAADNADESRLLRIVSGIDGGLWLVASILVGAALDAILWREAAAARALGIFIPLVDAPSRTLVRIVPPALLFVAGTLIASGRPDPWFVPCPSATLACDGMLVPVDHDAGSAATIWIVYAVHHAAGPPAGTLAIAVGGPGVSGLDSAASMIDELDPELVRRYDLLFFDQRGVGASEGHDCPHAGFRYATAVPGEAPARAFAAACITEAEVDPSTLARYSTHQAAEDLESIRGRLGLERFALYGESYGTELAQTYAALHPDRLSALILDGPVDLTRTANEFWADAARGFATVLTDTLEACTSDRECHRDVADPLTAYGTMLERFADGKRVAYADADGTVRDHPVDAAALESAIDILLYEPTGRMLIQRAVAGDAHGDLVPTARLVDALGGGEGLGVSSFAYHAITCADYRVSPTADASDFAAVEAAGEAAGVTKLPTDEVYTSQYPCLFWPYQPADGARPAPLTTTPYPVFVLGATDDPITPIAGAEAIAGRLSDGYLIRTSGGPHVTFGRGDACVDTPVRALLLDGTRPASRTIDCRGDVAAPYIERTATDAVDLGDPLDAMIAVEHELFANPTYVLWDGKAEVRFGCRSGGFISIVPQTVQDGIRFADCALNPKLTVTGTGRYVLASGIVSWSVDVPGGELDYTASDDRVHVAGTWNGQAVDVTR